MAQENLSIVDVLNKIQVQLNAPKDKNNSFGNYKFRSLEMILQAAKPLLKEYDAAVTFSDDLVLIGNRYYIKSTATLWHGSEQMSAVAFAREQETKKGMDEAQVTGSASPYARKYAACSLLAIDDNKEPDMMDNSQEGQAPTKRTILSDANYRKLVVNAARGVMTDNGETCEQWYIGHCKPTTDQLAKFHRDVEIFKQDNNL